MAIRTLPLPQHEAPFLPSAAGRDGRVLEELRRFRDAAKADVSALRAALAGGLQAARAYSAALAQALQTPASTLDDAETPSPRLDSSALTGEIRSHLDTLSPLALTTLRHLVLQDMQVFKAERDSVLLRALARKNLLHPMGSNAYPADCYPYRVPDAVWSELRDRYRASSIDPA